MFSIFFVKAMKIDEYEQGNHTSSCVDDVFYILKKSTTRILSSFNPDILSTFLSNLCKILELEYMNHLIRRLQSVFDLVDSKDTRVGFIILCNDVDVSCDLMGRLVKDIVDEKSRIEIKYPTAASGMGQEINLSLTMFGEAEKKFRDNLKVI